MNFSEQPPDEPKTLETPAVPGDASAGVPGSGHHNQAPPAQDSRSARRKDLIGMLAVLLGLALAGLPLGALWRLVVPRVEMVRTSAGWGLAEESPEEYIAADVIFALMGLAVGLAAAVVTWWLLRQRRGPFMLLGLVLGGIACQTVAWRFGTIGRETYVAGLEGLPVGWHTWRVPELLMVDFQPGQAWHRLIAGDVAAGFGHLSLGVLATAGFAAAFTYTVCAGWSRYVSLRAPDAGSDLRVGAGGEGGRDVAPTMQNGVEVEQEGRLPSLLC